MLPFEPLSLGLLSLSSFPFGLFLGRLGFLLMLPSQALVSLLTLPLGLRIGIGIVAGTLFSGLRCPGGSVVSDVADASSIHVHLGERRETELARGNSLRHWRHGCTVPTESPLFSLLATLLGRAAVFLDLGEDLSSNLRHVSCGDHVRAVR